MVVRYLSVTLAFMLMASGSISAQKFETPIEYVQFFNQEFANMQYLQMQYTSLVVHEDPETAEQISEQLDQMVLDALNKFGGVHQHPEDKGLKASAVQVLKTMQASSDKDTDQEIMDAVGCLDCFEAEVKRYELLLHDEAEIQEAMDNMNEQITIFAEANGIQMLDEESEGDYTVEVISRVMDYIQQIDLVVLEMQYAEDDIIDALNEQDIDNAKELNKELGKAINNAQKRMNKIETIKEDKTMWAQVERLIEFYKEANKTYFPEMLSAFDKDGQIINDKVDAYNDNINLMNTEKTGKFSRYYQSKDDLLRRVVPQPDEGVAGDRS